ncbi:MAG: DEAD/DEAH box helicase, partial [Acidobacteriota bacterium]
ALLRFQGGKKLPLQIQRMRSDDLMASVFPDVAACQENIVGDIQIPDHPLVREVMKDVLTEAMDIDGLRAVLRGIEDGSIRCLAVDTPVPSQFSHEILNANPYAYLDDAPLEERRARAVQMRRLLPESVLEEVGKLDPAAIAQVREEAWPDVRDADELHDVLQTLIALPEDLVGAGAPSASSGQAPARAGVPGARLDWQHYFEHLASNGRAGRVLQDGKAFWVCAERAQTFAQIYPAAEFETPLAKLDGSVPSPEDALLQMITGWMGHLGPTSAGELGQILSLPPSEVNKALLRLESTGAILRGKFTDVSGSAGTPAAESDPARGTILSEGHGFSRAEKSPISSGVLAPEVEWCERRLLARIHRLTLGTLRKQVEPVTAAQFMRWLLRWQHIASGTQVMGERGTLEVLQQLQGFEIPASAWERQVLARRIADYDPKVLDQLCLTGAVGWGRLSPHPATLEDSAEGKRRVVPTSVAPITFYVREEADWLPPHTDHQDGRGLSHPARQVLEFLRQHGASFFADIVRGSGKLKAEIETALWELVAAGLVTADGFDNLRSLLDPKRRSGQGSGRMARPRHSAGRWALLYPGEAAERTRQVEASCWMLLRRYGVVFRDLLAREAIVPKWRELAMAFRRLEDRGEVRGGRFISGFLGEQFALPVAVESLRAMRKHEPAGETITISAADPLNLVGIIVPGERVPAISGKTVTFRDGVAVPPQETSAHAATGD